MAVTWAVLADLRRRGQRPALPVLVTTDWKRGREYEGAGFLVLQAKPGDPMPVQWLDGLDVQLDLGSCQRAAAVSRLMRAKGVKPRWCRAWCECAEDLVSTCEDECPRGKRPC